jgi:hypothetical protein
LTVFALAMLRDDLFPRAALILFLAGGVLFNLPPGPLPILLLAPGAEPFDSVGQPFDPTLHEAIETIHGDSAEPGTVTRQVLRGWRLSGDLLRPARVIVAARTDDA